MPFRVVAHPCAYFAYIRAYTRVSWRRSSSDSAHPRSLRTLPHDIAYYMLVFLPVSYNTYRWLYVGYTLVVSWILSAAPQ